MSNRTAFVLPFRKHVLVDHHQHRRNSSRHIGKVVDFFERQHRHENIPFTVGDPFLEGSVPSRLPPTRTYVELDQFLLGVSFPDGTTLYVGKSKLGQHLRIYLLNGNENVIER